MTQNETYYYHQRYAALIGYNYKHICPATDEADFANEAVGWYNNNADNMKGWGDSLTEEQETIFRFQARRIWRERNPQEPRYILAGTRDGRRDAWEVEWPEPHIDVRAFWLSDNEGTGGMAFDTPAEFTQDLLSLLEGEEDAERIATILEHAAKQLRELVDKTPENTDDMFIAYDCEQQYAEWLPLKADVYHHDVWTWRIVKELA